MVKKILQAARITSRPVMKIRKWNEFQVFFNQGFFSRTMTSHKTVGEGRGSSLFLSTNSNRSQTFRHSFATLHLGRIICTFTRIACNYQTAAQ